MNVEDCYNKCHEFFVKYQKPNIPEEWVAGLIAVECSSLNPKASRFEPSVYKSVERVKNGYQSTSYPGFNHGFIKSYIVKTNTSVGLKSLATSYGLFQIMGYHYLNKFGLVPEQYANLTIEFSIKWGMEFMSQGMRFVKFPELKTNKNTYSPYEQYLRWHNSGSCTGQTFDPHYVNNAMNYAKLYKEFMEKIHE